MPYSSDIERRIIAASRPLAPIGVPVSPRLLPAGGGIRAVIFDIYGTLLISGSGDVGTMLEERSSRIAVEAFAAVGFEISGKGVMVSGMMKETIGRHQRLRREAGSLNPEVDIRDVWGEVCAGLKAAGILERLPDTTEIELIGVEYECRNNPVWPMPGMIETLEELRRRGIALGIVSNAQYFTPLIVQALTGKSLESLGFRRDCTVLSYRLLEAKPSVSIFRPVITSLERELFIAAEETLYVGNDMMNDILPASGLCMKSALFAGDARSYRPRSDNPSCADVEPDCVITDLRQILEAV